VQEHVLFFQQLTPWSTVLLEMLIVIHLVKKFLTLCGTRRFITVFTGAYHRSQPSARWIQYTLSHPVSLSSVFPKWSLPFRFPNWNFVLISYFSRECYMPYPSHPPWFYNPNDIWRRVQSMRPFIMQFYPGWETKFHIHTKQQVKFRYIIIFLFLDCRRKYKQFWTEW
jgi:hypothetical protein